MIDAKIAAARKAFYDKEPLIFYETMQALAPIAVEAIDMGIDLLGLPEEQAIRDVAGRLTARWAVSLSRPEHPRRRELRPDEPLLERWVRRWWETRQGRP